MAHIQQVVLSVVGTRPEAIKMAPVIKALNASSPAVKSVVCSTGQHREMLAQVWDVFGIQPDISLDVMTRDQSLATVTARILERLDPVLSQVRPDWVLAQGDTTTVLVAAILSHYHRVKFGHVEAGLRTGDKFRPFPEEMNRRIADVAADLHFAPTERSRQALLREGTTSDSVVVTGNTIVDAVMDIASRPPPLEFARLVAGGPARKHVLVTAHRRESFGEPFRELCYAIRTLAERFRDDGLRFIFPVHLNPNVQRPVEEILADTPNITLCQPVDYVTMVHLVRSAQLILTDSGGVQEEAPAFGVPVLVMRDTTERPEGIDAGVARLVGTSREKIVSEATRLLSDVNARQAMQCAVNPYGDGRAAQRIVSVLLERSEPDSSLARSSGARLPQ